MKSFAMQLLLPLMLILMMNCNSQHNKDQLQKQWSLISFSDFDKTLLTKNNAYLNLIPKESAENQYSAYMGCNNLFLTAKFDSKGNVEFSDIGATMMYCEGNMELERTFISQIAEMKSYRIENQHLILADGQGNEMIFTTTEK